MRSFSVLAAAGLFLVFGFVEAKAVEPDAFELQIRVVHARTDGAGLDPRLQDLKVDLGQLNYRSFKLLDGHKKQVFSRETIALEFPGNRWLNVRTKGMTKDGALKIKLSIRDLGFKVKAKVRPGSTILVGGPPHDGGAIVLALTAAKSR
ncbi:MAG: hypothetical protein CMH55_04395 [Myxococcales bacterium]|nr:hypothetical protein [Myxococcales bacterium]